MKEIPLTQGKVAIIDDDMYDYLMQFRWYYTGRYAATKSTAFSKTGNKTYMHRLVAQTPVGMETDHIDGDGLHNWRANLRNCTHAQNNLNRKANTHKRSIYKGVFWQKNRRCWGAAIHKNGSQISLGQFDFEEDAGIAYNYAALELFGEFAFFNDIPNWRSRQPNRHPGLEQRTNPTSGHKHVTWHKRLGKWSARILVNNRRVHIGYFETVEAAVQEQKLRSEL